MSATARRILFANFPADGHFVPLTGMAMQLKAQGHDVRWYTGNLFADKLARLGIPHLPFTRALEVNQFTIDDVFPERKALKPGPAQLKFDIKHVFVRRAPEFFEDVREIHAEFPFEVLVADVTFTAAELVRAKLPVKVVAVGVVPLMASSRDLPPYGLGLAPRPTLVGRLRDRALRFVAHNVLFRESTAEYNLVRTRYGLPSGSEPIFDVPTKVADLFLQSGTPGFEYPRSDVPANLRFVGPLHAHRDTPPAALSHAWTARLGQYRHTVLISQGTFEADHSKLIIPALEGLLGTDTLLIVTTGRLNTEALRAKYPQEQVVIEDFVDFDALMPKVDLYVTNGGYGGTLSAIAHGLPMVAAGINEGKNEICARIGHFKLGIDLRTERPRAADVRRAVETITQDGTYRANVARLRDEFRAHAAAEISARHILELLG